MASTKMIPPELLLRILHNCKLESELLWTNRALAYIYPWPYLHVCRYWRDVLISSPGEWTDIMLNSRRYSQSKEQNVQRDLARCRLQLKRSQDQPLYIAMDVVEDHPAIPCVYQESHRWKEIAVDGMMLEASLFTRALARCTRLEKLTFGLGCEHTGTFRRDNRLTLPLLRYLSLAADFDDDDHFLCSFNAPALRELEIRTEMAIETLELFLRVSLPHTLTTLLLNDIMLTTADKPLMESCLRSCPRLTNLTLWLPVGDASFTLHMMLLILTWESGNMMSPHLSTLKLLDADLGTTGDTRFAFLEMLASRSEAAARAGGFATTMGETPASFLEPQKDSSAWPKCFLSDVEITLADEVIQEDVFDNEQLMRIRELSSMMSFTMADGATFD